MLPSDLQNIVSLLSGCPVPWAVCGGWALDLFVGNVSRPHKDIDIAILRRDQHTIHNYLSERGWQLDIAYQGQFTPWKPGENVRLPRHVIWCKHEKFAPDFLELLLNESTETHFLYRRNLSIRRELERAFIPSASGVPILAPEIALLYKSKRIEVENTEDDFQNAIPHMNLEQLDWLRQALRIEYGSHTWLTALENRNDIH